GPVAASHFVPARRYPAAEADARPLDGDERRIEILHWSPDSPLGSGRTAADGRAEVDRKGTRILLGGTVAAGGGGACATQVARQVAANHGGGFRQPLDDRF